MAYYYLISSLPMLKSDGDMPLSYEQFLEMCRGEVNESKYEILENLSLSSNEGPLISEWAKFYGVLKEELTFQRNIRLGRKAQLPSIRDDSVSKVIYSAINNQNPLAAEETLLSLEFQRLDELVGIHYFDDYALIGYALKLKLLERKNSFDYKKGSAELNKIIKKLEHEIMSIE